MPGVVYTLLHPDKQLPGRRVLEILQTLNAVGMHPSCKDITVDMFADRPEKPSVLLKEELIVKTVTYKIMDSLL